jgi:FkbM family methyltransferase
MIGQTVNNSIKSALRKLNIGTMRYDRLQDLIQQSSELSDPRAMARRLEYLLTPDQAADFDKGLRDSRSQLLQDMFVLAQLNFKRNGFFVEFGATDGVALSNTHLLEKNYGWKGILAEPGMRWHAALKANRGCFIEESCVWKESGSTLRFKETDDAEYSTITDFISIDHHKKLREKGPTYEVKSVSLIGLLQKYDAPPTIDYLSVDTEGSEYEILRSFDFSRYQFKVITCEHNYTPARQKIYDLLTSNGYRRRFENVSLWDDWYVRN